MTSYDVIAKFYDSVVADPTKKALWLKQLVQKHNPNTESILELACGTGSLLEAFAKDYQIVGLDNSAEMLNVARTRLPDTEFVLADMSDFKIDKKFDAILCIYDSINHLIKFSDWQTMFAKVAQHLEPQGVFIFDMNTVEFLNRLNTSEASVSNFSNNTMTIGAEPNKDAITTLKVEVAERKPDGTIETHKTDIPEASFSIAEVQAALEQHFQVLEKLAEESDTAWTEKDDKAVFICKLR